MPDYECQACGMVERDVVFVHGEPFECPECGSDDYEQLYYAVQWGGRSSGSLHPDRNCSQIKNHDDEELIARPRAQFASDQKVCGHCG